jgi:hypothetical protein
LLPPARAIPACDTSPTVHTARQRVSQICEAIPSIFVVCFIFGPYVADLQVSTVVMLTLAMVMGVIGMGATLLLWEQRYRFARA